MALSDDVHTYPSPFLHSPQAEEYGRDSYYQHMLIQNAVKKFLQAPFDASADLSGAIFEVQVHEDGLHVSIRRKRA